MLAREALYEGRNNTSTYQCILTISCSPLQCQKRASFSLLPSLQVPGLYFVLKSKPNVKMDSLYFSKRYNRYIRSYKNDSQSGTFSPDLTWSLTTLPWVSPFYNLLHALTSWQLISHAFSQSQTPKKFWRCSHLLPGKISIDSQLNPKRTLSLRVWLHSFSLPWWPLHATKCADLSLLFLFFEMTAITEPKS